MPRGSKTTKKTKGKGIYIKKAKGKIKTSTRYSKKLSELRNEITEEDKKIINVLSNTPKKFNKQLEGKPRLWPKPEDLRKDIDKWKKEKLANNEPLALTDFPLWKGCYNGVFNTYASIAGYSNEIKRYRRICENWTVKQMLTRKSGIAGLIFVSKNHYNYADKTETTVKHEGMDEIITALLSAKSGTPPPLKTIEGQLVK